MEVIIVDSPKLVAERAADEIEGQVEAKSDAVLGLATGSTPLRLYKEISTRAAQNSLSYKSVTTFNLDEYIGLSASDPRSYRFYMDQRLFSNIDIETANTHVPSCALTEDPQEVCEQYEASIARAGGIDLQVLGIGTNGHIGFNEPSSSLSSLTRVKTLTDRTVRDNRRLFADNEFQPRLAITMGIQTISNATRVLLLATGKRKAAAVSAAIEGPVTAMCPASALQFHRNVTFIIDSAAASELKQADYYRWVEQAKQDLALSRHRALD